MLMRVFILSIPARADKQLFGQRAVQSENKVSKSYKKIKISSFEERANSSDILKGFFPSTKNATKQDPFEIKY